MKLYLYVKGEREDQVKSFCEREIRKIRDIELVEDSSGADMSILVLCETVKSQDEELGLALSFAVTSQFENKTAKTLINQSKLPASWKPTYIKIFNNRGTLNDHFLTVGPTATLGSIVANEVSSIEGADIDPVRSLKQMDKAAYDAEPIQK